MHELDVIDQWSNYVSVACHTHFPAVWFKKLFFLCGNQELV